MKKLISITVALLVAFLCVTVASADSSVSPSTVIALLQSAYSSSDGVEVEYKYDDDSSIYYMYITMDGIATSAVKAQSDSDLMDNWITMRDKLITLNTSFTDYISTLTGDSSTSLSLNLVNDTNSDNILLSILNSTVLYDAVAVESTSSSQTKSTDADTATSGENNALSSAKQYLDYSAFSYSGLIDQLKYEGYSNTEATYGADHCGADWDEQALKSAFSYLANSAFSESGLQEQLEYEGFTNSQAKYGVKNCGADWKEQAVKSAKSYMAYSTFSKSGLIDQLEYEGFTHSQAKYGAEQNGY